MCEQYYYLMNYPSSAPLPSFLFELAHWHSFLSPFFFHQQSTVPLLSSGVFSGMNVRVWMDHSLFMPTDYDAIQKCFHHQPQTAKKTKQKIINSLSTGKMMNTLNSHWAGVGMEWHRLTFFRVLIPALWIYYVFF